MSTTTTRTRPKATRMQVGIVAVLAVAIAAALGYTFTAGAGTLGGKSAAIASCQDELTSMMRDPDSVELDAIEVERGEEEPHGWLVSGDYRARNGFGGMNSDFFTCVTDPDGDDPTLLTGEMLDE